MTLYKDLENIILQDSQRSSRCYDHKIETTQKLTNIETANKKCVSKIAHNQYVYICRKMNIIKILHQLVKVLNTINEDDGGNMVFQKNYQKTD